MIFETLYESAQRGELLLVEGGFCHWHLRRDGQLTIREILVTRPNHGIGSELLATLRRIGEEWGAVCIVAKCPADLEANRWYAHKGFDLVQTECTPSGRKLLIWRLPL